MMRYNHTQDYEKRRRRVVHLSKNVKRVCGWCKQTIH